MTLISLPVRLFGVHFLACGALLWSVLAGGAAPAPVPMLKLTTELSWESALAGDPLRVGVHLTSPAQKAEALAQLQQREQGETNGTPLSISAIVADNWRSRIVFSLFRVNAQGSTTPLLPTSNWNEFARSNLDQQRHWRVLHKAAEWLVPTERVALTEGTYLLQVSWNGEGMGCDALLPSGGILDAKDLVFNVLMPSNDLQRATHMSRLAFQEYHRGNLELAGNHGQEAIRIAPSNLTPEGIDTFFIVASAQARLSNYHAAAETMQSLLRRLPPRHGETADFAATRFGTLAPELLIRQQGQAASPRVLLLASPFYSYQLEHSTNLVTWVPFTTNYLQTNWADVPLQAHEPPSFYRALWR